MGRPKINLNQKIYAFTMQTESELHLRHKKLIVVLGMHRSGTSAITRGLMTLGVDLGDNLLPPAKDNNETGFWEDLDIYEFNEKLLAKLGRHWYSGSLPPQEALVSDLLSQDRDNAAKILSRKLKAGTPFGIKDPRLCILLPFWAVVFEALAIEVRYVICVRSPESVIRSLERRDNLRREAALALWLTHTLSALCYTREEKRVIVDYDIFLEEPGRELARIAKCIGSTPPSLNSAEMADYTQNFLSKSLNHNQPSGVEQHDQNDSEQWATDVYSICKELALDVDTREGDVDAAFIELKKMSFALQQFDHADALAATASAAREELRKMTIERDRLVRDLHLLESDVRGQKQALDEILSSTSWKITEPIRRFRLIISGRTGEDKGTPPPSDRRTGK